MMISKKFKLESGYDMPALGLGTWKLKGKQCQDTVLKAIDLGYEHIDTAEAYENEEFIGKAIKGHDREKLFITSKVSPDHLAGKQVIESCDKSLERLGSDYLDLYLVHWPNDDIPIKETLDAMAELVNNGAVRSVGLSNFNKRRIENALTVTKVPICNLQIEYHPFTTRDYLPKFCQENGITITAYSPLARGRVFENKIITGIAEKYGKTPGQVALKWLIQNGNIVIPKASSAEHLEENMQLFDWMLEREDLKSINNIDVEERLIDTQYT